MYSSDVYLIINVDKYNISFSEYAQKAINLFEYSQAFDSYFVH